MTCNSPRLPQMTRATVLAASLLFAQGVSAKAEIALNKPVSTTKTAFGVSVLKGQSIDPKIIFPKSKYGNLVKKDAIERIMQGPCGAYSSIHSYSNDSNIIYDIKGLETLLNGEINAHNKEQLNYPKNIQRIYPPIKKVDGHFEQETMEALMNMSYSCG